MTSFSGRSVSSVLQEYRYGSRQRRAVNEASQLERELVDTLNKEIDRFDTLATEVGLPWLDKKIFREGLHGIASVKELPRVQELNNILQCQIDLSNTIRERYRERIYLIDEIVNDTCAMQKCSCSRQLHQQACALMKDIDRLTAEILVLVCNEWRHNLSRPQPFFIDGHNIVLRLCEDCSTGGIVSLISNHLWSTSRHLPFFYASTFDPNPQRITWRRPEIALMEDEYTRQMSLVEEQLELSRMGVYAPVLKFRVKMKSMCNLRGTVAATLFPINNGKWKKALIESYEQALLLLRHTFYFSPAGARSYKGSKDVHAAAAQFTMFSPKSLHLRYFRLWVDWAGTRHTRREGVNRMLLSSQYGHMFIRYRTWLALHVERTRRLKCCRGLYGKSSQRLQRVYLGRWFRSFSMSSTSRNIRRAIYLKYYNKLLLRYVARKLKQSILNSDRAPRYALAVAMCRKEQTRNLYNSVCALNGTRRAMYNTEKLESDARQIILNQQESKWAKGIVRAWQEQTDPAAET